MLFTELPSDVKENLYQKSRNKIIAFPEGEDPRVLKAAALLKKELNIECVLGSIQFGKDHKKKTLSLLQERAQQKGKALSPKAQEWSEDSIFAAGTLLALEEVDAVVAGCAHTTAHVIRAALNTVGLRDKLKILTIKRKIIYLNP